MIHSTLETGIDEAGRTLYLQEDVGQAMFRRVAVAFDAFLRQPRSRTRSKRLRDHEPILIHLMSGGGDVLSARAIAHMIETCPAPVTVVAHQAYSAACSFVLQAADERLALPYSHFMIHPGSVSAEDENSRFVQVLLSELKAVDKAQVEYMVERGASPDVAKILAKGEDFFFGAQKALDLGLIDGIILKEAP